MKKLGIYKERIDQLIVLANRVIETKQVGLSIGAPAWVSSELFFEFRTSSLSLILSLYGGNHVFYNEFDAIVKRAIPYDTERGRGILKSIHNEIEKGFLVTLSEIVSAEIFSDFLEMADYLLSEKYKDPAAVMIGSVLEEHLRQLAMGKGIEVIDSKSKKAFKADFLNAELSKSLVYNKLDHKSITTWLDLRNKAAHGKYDEYNQQQVEFMMQSVTEFINRTSSK